MSIQITYLAHSGFAVETATKVLVFDYYQDEQRIVRRYADGEKPLWFFVSHWHGDHFNRHIIDFSHKAQAYIVNKDVPFRQAPEDKLYSMEVYDTRRIDDAIVTQFGSTDEGGSFLVRTDGLSLFHAGDLNWWHWEGADKAWNNNMAANYKREIKELDGCGMDVAFVPLDGRLENAYYWGMKYFLEHVPVKAVFPMHCWDHYEICQKVQDEPSMQGLLEHFHPIEYKGQEWTLC